MSRKTKINVLLPIKMVGELERFAKNNTRSDFIQKAIRDRLDKREEYDIWQTETVEVINEAVARIRRLDYESKAQMIVEFIKRCMI